MVINHHEKILGFDEISDFLLINEISVLKEPFDKLWDISIRMFNLLDECMNGPIENVNAELVEREVEKMWKQSYRLTKLFQTPEFKGPQRVAISIKTKLQKFRLSIPIIHVVANPGLKERHWNIISKSLGVDISPSTKTSLNDILKFSSLIEDNLPRLSEITNLAGKEFSIEQAFKKMKSDWENIKFTVQTYYDTNLFILASFDDIQSMLDDQIVKTTTMKNSPFIEPFEQEVIKWFNELVNIKVRLIRL